jgi:hypothetical protein
MEDSIKKIASQACMNILYHLSLLLAKNSEDYSILEDAARWL